MLCCWLWWWKEDCEPENIYDLWRLEKQRKLILPWSSRRSIALLIPWFLWLLTSENVR